MHTTAPTLGSRPRTDSIKKLAEFWDSHDLTDFEDELEEVAEPVFVRSTAIKVPLEVQAAEAVARMAWVKGVSPEQLVLRACQDVMLG